MYFFFKYKIAIFKKKQDPLYKLGGCHKLNQKSKFLLAININYQLSKSNTEKKYNLNFYLKKKKFNIF